MLQFQMDTQYLQCNSTKNVIWSLVFSPRQSVVDLEAITYADKRRDQTEERHR